MYFRHHPSIYETFPNLVPGVMIVDGIHTEADFGDTIDQYYATAKDRLAASEEGSFPEISAWRSIFSQMNLKPTKYRCAAESLLRRLRKDGDFPKFHPLVDVCNAFSMAFATPIAVIDRDQIEGGIEVSFAQGDENHLAFSDEIEHPEPKEVMFKDEAGHAHSRRWCFRQSKHSVITPKTQKALIVIEGHHDTAREDIERLMQGLVPVLGQAYNVTDQQILQKDAPEILF